MHPSAKTTSTTGQIRDSNVPKIRNRNASLVMLSSALFHPFVGHQWITLILDKWSATGR